MYPRLFILSCSFGLGLIFPAASQAAGVYGGPNYYGAYATASANGMINTSGPANVTEANGTVDVNGLLSASASASDSNVSGAVSATGNANVGHLGGIANAAGVNGCAGLFQQPCINSGNYTEFYDQFHLTGAPDGTPVTIQFTLTTSGTVQGTGYWGYQTRLSDGWYTVENSDGSGGTTPTVDMGILKTASWTGTYLVGSNYPLIAWMNMSVGERTCLPTCSSNTAITLDLSHTSLASATILAPGNIQIVSASGYDYLNPVPIPAAGWLFGSGLLGLVGVARHKKTTV